VSGYQSIPTVYRGTKFRSRLEVHFASELDAKGIPWIYEPKRIGGEQYLIDFYLPTHRCWVEVKGQIATIDQEQLPLVAQALNQNNEMLFMYQSDGRAFMIAPSGWHPLDHAQLFQMIASRQPTVPIPGQQPAAQSTQVATFPPQSHSELIQGIPFGQEQQDVQRPMGKRKKKTLLAKLRDELVRRIVIFSFGVMVVTVLVFHYANLTPSVKQFTLEPVAANSIIISTLTQTAIVEAVSKDVQALVNAFSVIIRPSPGDRTKSIGEASQNSTLVIRGYVYVPAENVIWWKVTSEGGLTGWVINNPELIEVKNLEFDTQGLPANVNQIVQ